MDTRLKDIISKENRNVLKSFLGAQTFNIIVTCLIAWLMFGVVKPAVWPDKKEAATESVEAAANEVVVAESEGEMLPTAPAATEHDLNIEDYTQFAGEAEEVVPTTVQ